MIKVDAEKLNTCLERYGIVKVVHTGKEKDYWGVAAILSLDEAEKAMVELGGFLLNKGGGSVTLDYMVSRETVLMEVG